MKLRKYDGANWLEYDAVNTGSNTLTGSNITGFSNYDGGGGIALPIELLSFYTEQNNDDVTLKWITGSEINHDFFTVERSSDQINYENIGEILGAGNSNIITKYQFPDRFPLDGTSYYKLRQTDFNGTYKYSKTIAISRNKDAIRVNLFPNPTSAGNSVFVKFHNKSKREIVVVLLSPLGQTVFTKISVFEEGETIIGIDLSENIAPGIYFVVGTNNQQLFRTKLLVK